MPCQIAPNRFEYSPERLYKPIESNINLNRVNSIQNNKHFLQGPKTIILTERSDVFTYITKQIGKRETGKDQVATPAPPL